MTDENSKTIGNSIEETRLYHRRYLRAINSPIRRKILRAIRDGNTTIKDITSSTGLARDTLNWHLSILEDGFCIEKNFQEGKTMYTLTQEGKIIDFLAGSRGMAN